MPAATAENSQGPRQWLALAAIFFAILLIDGSGSFLGPGLSLTATAFDASLRKPPWAPPNWLFGPAWTLLYVLMAVAAWRIWRAPPTPARRRALQIFVAQLILNAAWTPIFFGLQAIGAALIEVAALWIAVLVTLRQFAALDRTAGRLLYPYLAWVSFATALNAAIWWLNR